MLPRHVAGTSAGYKTLGMHNALHPQTPKATATPHQASPFHPPYGCSQPDHPSVSCCCCAAAAARTASPPAHRTHTTL